MNEATKALFKLWAKSYAESRGFIVEASTHGVILNKDRVRTRCLTTLGVKDVCSKSARRLILAQKDERP